MRNIERVIRRVQAALPEVVAEQFEVCHPGVDDDGLWFFRLPGRTGSVQAESSTGMCPFVVEGTGEGQCVERGTVEETAATVIGWLKGLA